MAQTVTDSSFFAKKMTLRHFLTSRTTWGVLFLGLVAASWAFLPGVLSKSDDPKGSVSEAQTVYVKTMVLECRAEFKIPVWYSGEIVARRKTMLGFQRNGRIVEVTVDEGDWVNEGDVIARLDHRQLSARIKQLGAEMLVAKARLAELEAGPRQEAIRSAAANLSDLRQQRKNSQLDLERASSLLPRGAISQQEFDQVDFQVKAIDARIAAATAQLDELVTGTRVEKLQAARAGLEGAQAANELAEYDLDDCTLKAPFSGNITRRMTDEGAVVDAGQPVIELVESEHLEIHVGLPVELAHQLETDDTLSVETGKQSTDAKLRSKLSALNTATRTQKVVLTLDKTAAEKGVVDGQLGRVKFENVNQIASFKLPTSAIVNDQQGLWSCFTVEAQGQNQIARRQSIDVLHFQGDFAYVRGTLSDGQLLVTDGLQRLSNGQVVQMVDMTEANREFDSVQIKKTATDARSLR